MTIFSYAPAPVSKPINFAAINAAALPHLHVLCQRWLPDGKLCKSEWEAINPTRDDRRPGSFKVNIRTGKWSDFATGDRGGDVVSLAAFLGGIRQHEAALELSKMLGIET